MEISRRQFFTLLGASSAAAAVTPTTALEGLSTHAAGSAVAQVATSASSRIGLIEQAMVSTYGLLDLTGRMRGMGGLIDGVAHTAYSLAAHHNFMLGEVDTPEAHAVLLRLLRPSDVMAMRGETLELFHALRRERILAGLPDDVDDYRASFMSKLERVIERISKNRDLSTLIAQGNSHDPLAVRIAGWCDKLFKGELEQLSQDRLFDALRRLHRINIVRDVPFSPTEQRQILQTLEREGYSNPTNSIYGHDLAKQLRRCELLEGEIENEILSSRTLRYPQHLTTAAQKLLSDLGRKSYFTYAWQNYYCKFLSAYISRAHVENSYQ